MPKAFPQVQVYVGFVLNFLKVEHSIIEMQSNNYVNYREVKKRNIEGHLFFLLTKDKKKLDLRGLASSSKLF